MIEHSSPQVPSTAIDGSGARESLGPRYLLIETRCAWEGDEVQTFLRLAVTLADAGHGVDMFLVQNAVLMACASVQKTPLADLLNSPYVTVWADDFSLASRARGKLLLEGIQTGNAATLLQIMTHPGCKTIWH